MILVGYLFRQVLPPFGFGILVFSGVLLLDKIFDLMDLLMNKGVGLGIILKMFLLFLPTVLSLTVPMSALLASILAFGRLAEDNEITALRASGLSFLQILSPTLLAVLALCLLLIPFNAFWAPKSTGHFRSLYHQILKSDPLIRIEPKQFLSIQNVRLYARDVAPDRSSMRDVLLYQYGTDYSQRIFARQGRAKMENDALTLSFQNGQLTRFVEGKPKDVMQFRFDKYELSVPLQGPDSTRGISWREMTREQLKKEIRTRIQAGAPQGVVNAELQLRYAISFSPLALVILGIPLGLVLERGGRGVGFGASLGVVFGYYLLLIWGLTMAEKDSWPAIPALWMANIVAVVAGLALYRIKLNK